MCKVIRKRVGGEEHMNIPSARKELNSFGNWKKSQYSWRLKGKERQEVPLERSVGGIYHSLLFILI